MGDDREMEAALNCYAHENRELRAEVERLTRVGEALAAVATGGDAMLARADDYARRALGDEHDSVSELFYEAICEGRMAMAAEVERLEREAQDARRAAMEEAAGRMAGLAEVLLSTGRLFLSIGGMVVAVEGDPCRDAEISGSAWNRESLHAMADRINAAAIRAAKEER